MRWLACAPVLWLLMGFAQANDPRAAEFEQHVRPLLVKHCYECHSGDSKFKGGLRLDLKSGWETGGDSGPAIQPGEVDTSLLVRAIRYAEEGYEMPPTGKLPPEAIRTLERWIADGAYDPRTGEVVRRKEIDVEQGRHFWSYRPVVEPPLPAVTNPHWPLTPVDHFVLAKLEANHIVPAPAAGHAVLARRLYFDLWGVPPSTAELAAFAPQSQEELAQIVDQMLADRRFAEHWARHWLDVARYAESLTLRGFIFKQAWRYRDYVIEAYANDLPYDQFVREQLAGDLLPAKNTHERQRRMTATTYLALGNSNLEEQDKRQLEMDIVDEQLDAMSKGFLAQTVTCARCHDHKFDPIPTRDYYALAGILKNSQLVEHDNVSKWKERPLPLPADEEEQQRARELREEGLQSQINRLKAELKQLAAGGSVAAPRVVPQSYFPGVVLDDSEAKAIGEWKHSQHAKTYVGDGYLHDLNMRHGEKSLTFEPTLSPGRYEVRLAYTAGDNRASNVSVRVSSADGDQIVLVNQQQIPDVDGHFTALGQFRHEPNGQFFVIVSNEAANGHVIVDAVQFLRIDDSAGLMPVAALLDTSAAQRETEQQIAKLESELKTLRKTEPRRPRVMTVVDRTDPQDTYIHVRGLVANVGETVPRGFLQVASVGTSPQILAGASGRLELAHWMTDAQHPLTGRVYVNRVWHWLFGAGLVRTPDNFGSTGESPTHPELLDWLTHRFITEGWSTRRLIRQLVLSRVYQQSAQANPALLANDPENRLWGSRPPRRLPAEAIRDAMLVASGELTSHDGGPTYPADQESDYSYVSDALTRSVYLPAFRNSQHELLTVFDAADGNTVLGSRNASTVAPQALVLTNHPWVIARAQQLAVAASAGGATERDFIQNLYRRTLSRDPSAAEVELSLRFLQDNTTLSRTRRQELLAHALICSIEFRYVP